MGDGNTATVVSIAILIMISAFFSASETSFSALNRIRIKTMAESGDKRAGLVFSLYEDYDNLLSTILIGNNIVNIAAASLGTILFVRLYGDIGATISTILITVVVLVFGEVSPKSLAKEAPEKFAMAVAPVLRGLVFIFTPLNFLFRMWKQLLSRLFKTPDDSGITEEELLTMVDEAQTEGAIEEGDKELIRSVIEFNDEKAEDILTPRVDVVGVEVGTPMEEISRLFIDTGYSRLPVYEGSLDNIIGLIYLKDFYILPRNVDSISGIVKPVIYVVPNLLIGDLLKMLQKSKTHMAVVMDEYGGTDGIITLEDILEELVGEIWDEHDEVVESIVEDDKGALHVLCSADLGRVLAYLELESESHSPTVGGWIMEVMGRVPSEGDSFIFGDYRVTVTKMDGMRAVDALFERVGDQSASTLETKN